MGTSRCLYAFAVTLTLGCSAEPDEPPSAPGPLLPMFTIAVITDTHITTDPEREQRLQNAVDWMNDNAAERNIELIAVLGDIGWGQGLPRAKQLLDGLTIPYVPLLGDNELAFGDEAAFQTVFGPQYELLGSSVDRFRKAPTPVRDPVAQQDAWLQNFAFSYRGVHFFGLDWNARGLDDVMSEFGVLNDFEGGTLPWWRGEMTALAPTAKDSVILLSHIPMVLGGMDAIEMDTIQQVVAPWSEQVYANLAGHLHAEFEQETEGFDVFVIDAVFDDDNVIRLLEVRGNGEAFAYEHENIVVR